MKRRPVLDSSGYIGLADIGQLDLVRQVYGSAVMTHAVRDEIGPGNPDPKEIGWIELVPTPPRRPELERFKGIDDGEGSVLSFVLSHGAANFIPVLDNGAPRKAAEELELEPIGIIGILRAAKHLGHISAVLPYLQALEDLNPPFFMSETLIVRVLRAEGEAPETFRLNPNSPRRRSSK